jgi:hypothetical protein
VTSDTSITASRSARKAVRCSQLLRERVSDTAPVSVRTLFHDDGSFRAEAFHTVYRKRDDPNANGPFAREVVTYREYDNLESVYEHAVQHYYDGQHRRHRTFVLERIDPDEVNA